MPSDVASTYLYNSTGASPFRVDQHIYDPLAVMAAIGARTTRVRIGTSVLIVPYRNPVVLAKTLSTIDRISHGRVILGIGVGWMAEEFAALGIGDQYASRGSVRRHRSVRGGGPAPPGRHPLAGARRAGAAVTRRPVDRHRCQPGPIRRRGAPGRRPVALGPTSAILRRGTTFSPGRGAAAAPVSPRCTRRR